MSGQFSDLLMEHKNFKEAKALLEESIFSLNTNTENQVLVQWYYRTGRVYEETGNYNMSTKCYEHAFVLLPTHPTAAYHL
ncbi:tetratricopeptide repeat protein [Rickettsia massiliae]|uniref:tetratricopeptide repeat protein n=1 Tax=Rickettsia massiliae TaxID=35791 RepID=UPI0002F3DEF1|nr:tetratricopeptide repeat protein [Rickettsia massiliae]